MGFFEPRSSPQRLHSPSLPLSRPNAFTAWRGAPPVCADLPPAPAP
jgi:hypothetical protein